MEIEVKYERLIQNLIAMESALVAFSGGVDSTLVLKVAYNCLGNQAIGVTAVSPSLPASELEEARTIARHIGVQHILINSYETQDPNYLANTPLRCYFCKNDVYARLVDYASQNGYQYVLDGTNADDAGDHRPGRKAARQYGVRSPLLEVGLSKAEVRQLAMRLGLPNWDKPAAACLSSRVPYGTSITPEMLSQIEQAERVLKVLGIRQVRVRHHNQVARIEVEPQDFEILLEHRQEIIAQLEALGYQFVTMDLAGFSSGSLNRLVRAGLGAPSWI